MKKRILLLMAIGLSVLTGCGNQQKSSAKSTTLIVYFSHSNNTETIANYIKDITGADIIRIEPQEPYSPVDSICGIRVNEEVTGNIHPSIRTKIENLEDYDVIFVGSPLWHGTIAPPVKTLLENYDLSNKTLVPFTTYGSQGLGSSVEDIKELCPQSTMLKAHAFNGRLVDEAKPDVIKWLQEINVI